MTKSFLFLSAFLFACSSTTNTTNNPAPGPSSTSTSTPNDGDADVPSIPKNDGGTVAPSEDLLTCANQPAPTSALVAPQLVPQQAAPSPAGGAISDGAYHLSAVKAYGNAADPLYASLRLKERLEIANGEWRIAYHYEATTENIDGAHSGTFIVAGTVLGGEEKCDAGDASNGIGGFLKPFSATSTSIDIFEDTAKQIVFTYSKD